MSIKFRCPHCEKALSVKDQLAGKKGTCPGCKKVVIVPMSGVGARANGTPAPPAAPKAVMPADVEAEAAAVLSDKPAEQADAEPQNIDFNCPMCDDPISAPIADAGKNTQCPSCRRIVKVPLPKKLDKIDWKKPGAGVPSLARQDLPAVDGAWGNKEATGVSREALEEAGALPELVEPITTAQRIQRGLLVAAACAFVVAGYLWTARQAAVEKQADTLAHAVAYLKSEEATKRLGPEGVAELHRAVGVYYLRSRQADAVVEAQRHFDLAFQGLRDGSGLERDMVLTDLALVRVELGGSGDEVDEGRRLNWDDTKYGSGVIKMVRATLGSIQSRPARLEALRPVMARLIARGQARSAYALANSAFGNNGKESLEVLAQMEARGITGLELWRAGQQAEAEKVADILVQEYSRPTRPPLAASVVALMMVLGRPELKPGKGGDDADNQRAGRAEGHARLGELEKARALVASAPHDQLKLWALVNIATAVLDASSQDQTDLNSAFELALNVRIGNPWLLWRLLHLGLRAGIAEDRSKRLLERMPEGSLRARGQVGVVNARLAGNVGVEADEVVQMVDDQTISRALAHESLARRNVRHDKSSASRSLSWPEPYRAFGAIGVALGMQDE